MNMQALPQIVQRHAQQHSSMGMICRRLRIYYSHWRLMKSMPICLEYAVGNPVFAKKIDSLSHSFSSMRRTRGDGNCFYRAFIFSYLEGLLLNSQLLECAR